MMFRRFAIAATVLMAGAVGAAQTRPAGGPAPRPPAAVDAATLPLLPVQRSVYMLPAEGGNIAVQIGDDGILLVDARTEALAPRVAAAVRTLTDKPLQVIVNTSADVDHTSGTGALVTLLGGAPQAPRVMAQANVLIRLQAEGSKTALSLNAQIVLPVTTTYFTPSHDFFLNGEAVFLHHVPAAHTDGDSLVYVRGSDVIAAGDVITPDRYPVIDLANGGSVNGTIAALNRIMDIAVPAKFQEGGTYVIPGHGRLCDEADVVEYRDMVTIIRDRVRDLIAKGMTLDQVRAARPSRDYDTEYGSDTGPWTTAMFVDAVYRSLTNGRR
jgi:glyoxylase-like metal-dependent hydrolase (beta-lactamase superfamily II)